MFRTKLKFVKEESPFFMGTYSSLFLTIFVLIPQASKVNTKPCKQSTVLQLCFTKLFLISKRSIVYMECLLIDYNCAPTLIGLGGQ